jgi:hypothetical protein
MPRVYRGMREENSVPALGSSSTTLGVRLPDVSQPGLVPDITPDASGLVKPGQGGISVSPDIVHLPPHAIPTRLKSRYPRASGNARIRIRRLGEGPFSDGSLSDELSFRVDPKNAGHGFIEPASDMHVNAYLDAIRSTRDQWQIAEDD